LLRCVSLLATNTCERCSSKLRTSSWPADQVQQWEVCGPGFHRASKRLHRNMLAIALANKLARIAWAVLARGHEYQPPIIPHAA